jgi:uncharacterized protein YecT (DUF1311 family)
MNLIRPLLLLAVVLAASPAYAAKADCGRRGAPATAECAEQRFEAVQGRLDQLMHELKGTLSRKNWGHVRESEIYWEKSRSLECHVETDFVAGMADQDVVKYQCLEDHTVDRMHQLRFYLCPRYVHSGQCDAEKAYE